MEPRLCTVSSGTGAMEKNSFTFPSNPDFTTWALSSWPCLTPCPSSKLNDSFHTGSVLRSTLRVVPAIELVPGSSTPRTTLRSHCPSATSGRLAACSTDTLRVCGRLSGSALPAAVAASGLVAMLRTSVTGKGVLTPSRLIMSLHCEPIGPDVRSLSSLSVRFSTDTSSTLSSSSPLRMEPLCSAALPSTSALITYFFRPVGPQMSFSYSVCRRRPIPVWRSMCW
mmetsp:Transcript_38229/g.76508  ORF Transcript_38229/g.76508 Transcript_38229/m.76508 type:complete len:225 (+) Transcript_38229:498-1172(+)